MADLRSFTRDLTSQMEKDLGTRLDWVAVDHWNTEHSHVHLIVRGVRDDGQDLVIARLHQGGHRRRQHRHQSQRDVGIGRAQPIRHRRTAGDTGRQPAPRPAAQQLADLTAVIAANDRAQALIEAERAAAAEQGREQRRRFLTPGSGYQSGSAKMFYGN